MKQPSYLNSNTVLCVVEYLLGKLTKSVTESVIEIQDQTGVLAYSFSTPKKLSFQAKEWTIIPYKSVIDIRRLLWESKPLRIMLILPKDANRTALADILASRHLKVLIADSASILNGLASLDLPSDERLTPLLPHLLSKLELLKRYYKANLRQSDIPAFILSVLLDSDVFIQEGKAQYNAPMVFAQVAQGEGKLPKEAEPFIEEYISALPKEDSHTASAVWRDKIGQLLRFSGNRSNVLAELLRTYTQLSGGGLGLIDAALVELIGEKQSQEQLQEWSECIREALFAVPSWGRKVALKADSGDVSDKVDYLKSALENDIKKQVREIVDGNRTSLDSAWWSEHLFAPEMEDSIKVAKEISALMDVLALVSEMVEEAKSGDLGKVRWAQWYSENGAYADLIWMRLKKQIPKVSWLADDITKAMELYQKARSELNRLFAKELVENYKIWVNGKDVPTVANILNKFVKPTLQQNKALLLIVDGLSYPIWRNIASDMAKRRLSLSEEPVISLLPTVTGVGRKAIFAGASPKMFYPYLAEDAEDEEESQSEEVSLRENLKEMSLRAKRSNLNIALFRKRHLNEQFASVNSKIADADVDLVCVIINEIDDALRAQSGDLTKNLDDLAYFSSLIQIGIDAGRVLIVASDHGFTPDGGERVKLQDVKVKEDFDRFAVVTEYVEAEGVIVAEDLLYDFGGKVALLTDFGTRLNIQHNGYHGGASLEEVIVPCAVIKSGITAPSVEMNITGIPPEVMEDSNVTFLLEVHAKGAPIEDLTVDLLLPSKKPISFKEKSMEIGSWVKWEANWQPSLILPSDEKTPQAQKATIRARITSPEALSGIEAYCNTIILPKRGKTTRAVDELLPEF